MKPSQSLTIPVRGLNLHCRRWGAASEHQLFLLHGFQDSSASWQFTVDALSDHWQVIAPDWRGYGQSDWAAGDTYGFFDHLADLDALLAHFRRTSRPGWSATTWAARSRRSCRQPPRAGAQLDQHRQVRHRRGPPGSGPRRLGKWLSQLREPVGQRRYESFEAFAQRLQAENPRLTDERALFLATHWGRESPDGGVERRADPAHSRLNPLPLPTSDMLDCWREDPRAGVVDWGEHSPQTARLMSEPLALEERLQAYAELYRDTVADAGHNVHHDQPEALARAIEKFLFG
ncbi:MAG: alpha/beta hydrolase [Burkholderiaceae bacterium]